MRFVFCILVVSGVLSAQMFPFPGPKNVIPVAASSWVLKDAQSASTSFPAVTTPALNCTGADLIVISAASYTAYTPAAGDITDSQSNSYSLILTYAASGTEAFFYKQAPSVGGAMTFTFTPTVGSSFPAATAACFSGSVATPLDQSNSSTSVATSVQTGSITPTTSGQLLIAVSNNNDTTPWTINSGFTIASQINGGLLNTMLAYFVQTSAAAINPTLSGPTMRGAAIASFK